MARSCSTRDASNKDNVYKPTIPAGINHTPPSETISHVTRVPNHQNTLSGTTGLLSVSDEGPCEKSVFLYKMEKYGEKFGVPPKAKSHREEDSWSDGTGRRSDLTRETSEPALKTPSTGVEATPRRVTGSSWERK